MRTYYSARDLYIKFNEQEYLWELLIIQSDEAIYQDSDILKIAELFNNNSVFIQIENIAIILSSGKLLIKPFPLHCVAFSRF